MEYRRLLHRDTVRFLNKFLRVVLLGLFLLFCWKVFDTHTRGHSSSFHFSGGGVKSSNSVQTSGVKTNKIKTILWYTEPHYIINDHFGVGHEPFVQHNCSVSDCAIYTAPTNELPLRDFDAVIVYALKLRNFTKVEIQKLITPDSKRRSPHQRYIFFNVEPSLKLWWMRWGLYRNFYNWTMTHKKDSDIWMPYGMIDPLPNTKPPASRTLLPRYAAELLNHTRGKTKLLAWFVSHCRTESAREIYVQNLKSYINVDIYGACGNLSCPRIPGTHTSDESCYEMADKLYKFYLSFESSFCTEYVTEKLFSVLKHHIVPIVFGSAHYKSLLPEHSYINALDYTPQELAVYLKYLDQNHTAYQEYFWWKPYYKLYGDWDAMSPVTMCKLCEKLHEPLVPKYYRDISILHGIKTNCLRRHEVVQIIGNL